DPADGLSDGDGMFYRNSRVKFSDITDGSSNTIMIGERSSKIAHGTWTGAIPGTDVTLRSDPSQKEAAFALVLAHGDHGPNSPSAHIDDYYSHHTLGVNFLLGDGSVHPINNSIAMPAFRALQTRAGGETEQGAW